MLNKEDQLSEKKEETISSTLRKNIQKYKKILLTISFVAFLIILVNLPRMTLEQVGGMDDMGGPGGNSVGNGGESGGKQKSSLLGGVSSPLTSGVNMMWWITKNILLFYVFLLFITVVPSLPIIIYITIFYFIINGLIGRIKTL